MSDAADDKNIQKLPRTRLLDFLWFHMKQFSRILPTLEEQLF